MKEHLALNKFNTMQLRVRGVKTFFPPQLIVENQQLTEMVNIQGKMMLAIKEDLAELTKQRDFYYSELVRVSKEAIQCKTTT